MTKIEVLYKLIIMAKAISELAEIVWEHIKPML